MVFGFRRRNRKHQQEPAEEPQVAEPEVEGAPKAPETLETADAAEKNKLAQAVAVDPPPGGDGLVRAEETTVAETECSATETTGEPSLSFPFPQGTGSDTLPLMSALLRLHGAEDTASVAEAASLLGRTCLDRTHPLLLLADKDGALRLEAPKSAATATVVAHLSSLLGIDLTSSAPPSRQGPLARIWLDDAAGVHVLSLADLWGARAGIEECQRAEKILGISQVSGVRLASPDEPLGVALFLSCGVPPEPAMVDATGRHLTVVLANLRSVEKARQFGTVDPIRWIADHAEFTRQLSRETDRARRYGHPVSVALLVVDNFDALRLEYGWTVANRLLRSVSAALTECLRESDFLGAYRHDGFGVILVQITMDSAPEAASRLREKAAAVRVLEGEDGPVPECVVAIASCPEDGANAGTLLMAAESRLLPKRRLSSASA